MPGEPNHSVLGALAFRLRPGEESGLAHVLHHGSWCYPHGAPESIKITHGLFLEHFGTIIPGMQKEISNLGFVPLVCASYLLGRCDQCLQ